MPRLRNWPELRQGSPARLSTLMISAPQSPRVCVPNGPNSTVVRSRMRKPLSGPVGLFIWRSVIVFGPWSVSPQNRKNSGEWRQGRDPEGFGNLPWMIAAVAGVASSAQKRLNRTGPSPSAVGSGTCADERYGLRRSGHSPHRHSACRRAKGRPAPHRSPNERLHVMLTIDSQVHVYERDHPGRPWNAVLTGPPEVTGDDMVAAMDAVGVDGAVLVSAFTMYGYDASYALGVRAAHP